MSEEKRDLSSMSPEDLQSAVQGILADPAFAKLLGGLSGGASEKEREEKDAPPAPPQISPEAGRMRAKRRASAMRKSGNGCWRH